MAPGVDSASNKNEYQEYFLGGKRGRCVGLTTLPPSCLEIWKPQPPGGLSRPVMGLQPVLGAVNALRLSTPITYNRNQGLPHSQTSSNVIRRVK
jgi:hypothetical protein